MDEPTRQEHMSEKEDPVLNVISTSGYVDGYVLRIRNVRHQSVAGQELTRRAVSHTDDKVF